MNDSVVINTAICLPVPDIEALIQGRAIVAMCKTHIDPDRQFGLYPTDASMNILPVEQYYQKKFLATAKTAVSQLSAEAASIKVWARCEKCEHLYNTESLAALSPLTIWTTEALQEILTQRNNIFLVYLRVYHLAEFKEISVNPDIKEKVGKFVGLSKITASDAKPVLSDRIFAQRQRQLQNLEPPKHPELEELQSALSQIATTNPDAQQLDNEIKIFLGWSGEKLTQSMNADLAWIKTIVSLGDRSIELDEKKSNYQAGTDFEIIARQSLDFLGFKIEEAYQGGAGGLDLFCSQPYPLVCECKAGKSIPDRAVEELDRIGKRHLKENYLQAVRLILGPGQPTKNLKESAVISKISIINVMTLQKLVELKAKYPGAINLFELQKYLEPGQIDNKIDEYIDKIEQQIKLRSHIIQLVKNYLQNSGNKSTGVETLHGVYFGSNPPQPLKIEEMHEILIELSSPLIGYLGREKGRDWKSDRFYFLRELVV